VSRKYASSKRSRPQRKDEPGKRKAKGLMDDKEPLISVACEICKGEMLDGEQVDVMGEDWCSACWRQLGHGFEGICYDHRADWAPDLPVPNERKVGLCLLCNETKLLHAVTIRPGEARH